MKVDEKISSLLNEQYGFILEDALLQEMVKVGQFRHVKAGEALMDYNETITAMPMLLSGSLKIIREDKDGNELLLYYLESGDTCAMSFTCCMGQKKSQIRAVAEKDSELLLIPSEYLDKWLLEYPSWKSYVFESYHTRLDEFLEAIDALAFMKLDERLLKYLRDKAMVTGSTELQATHQEMAYDLNTSRVVVSRLLKQMEKEGVIKMHRNKVELIKL